MRRTLCKRLSADCGAGIPTSVPKRRRRRLQNTVRSIGIDEWRRKQAHPTEPLAADAYADCVDSESTDEIFERVQRLIDSCLSPAQQSIIRLHDYEQRGYDEIANRLNMEPAAVRMQLSRRAKKLENAITNDNGYERLFRQ